MLASVHPNAWSSLPLGLTVSGEGLDGRQRWAYPLVTRPALASLVLSVCLILMALVACGEGPTSESKKTMT